MTYEPVFEQHETPYYAAVKKWCPQGYHFFAVLEVPRVSGQIQMALKGLI
jgi:hypothetical protein